MMIKAITDGIILGLSLATFFGFGPALLALLQTSLQRGFKAAVSLAFGVFLSDLFLVILSFAGIMQIVEEPKNKLSFAVISGLVLITFGVVTFLKKPRMDIEEIEVKNPKTFTYILKGFFLNVANPFIWIFWMGTMIGITTSYKGVEKDILTLFVTALLIVFMADTLKAYLAGKLKPLLTPKLLILINKIAGIGLILFGIALMIRAFFNL